MRVLAFAGVASALVFQRKGDPEPWACYMNSAEEYMGTTAVANSGQQCMQWSDAAQDEKIGTLYLAATKGQTSGRKLEGNFCRAFATDTVPWCFVDGVKSGPESKQDCDVKKCPTDGPWGRDFGSEAAVNVKCSDESGAPAVDCDCSCDGVAGNALIQLKNGGKRICHCPM